LNFHTVVTNLLLKRFLLALELIVGIVKNLNHLLDFRLVLLNLEQPATDVVLLPLQQFLIALLLVPDGCLQKLDLLLVAMVQLLDGSGEVLLVGLELLHARFEVVGVRVVAVVLIVHLNYTVNYGLNKY
jgi:hypothetical protein